MLDSAAARAAPLEPTAGDTDAASREVAIRVRDLRFRYPGVAREALAGISLDVARGEFLGITGPSGAGKSTLCLCLKGLVPAGEFSGSIEVAGRTVGPASRLGDYLNSDTYRLSGGQKQRLAIADALILEPEILILDEPTSELDPIGKDEVFEVLERLRSERSITVIMVEHAAEQLAEMADRIVLMQDGLVVDQGPPDDLYRNPLLFHRPDAERSPQISQVLFQLMRAGLLTEDDLTAREELGVARLRTLLQRARVVQSA